MGIALREFGAVRCFVAERLIVAESEGYIGTHKADAGLVPGGAALPDSGPLEDGGDKSEDLGAALLPDAERVGPLGIVSVVALENGGVECVPGLAPVVDDGADCRLIFRRAWFGL